MLASVSYRPRRKVASLALQHCCAILRDMARPLRLEVPGALYHLMSHDNGGTDMYLDDWDREAFLKILGTSASRGAGCVMRLA
jgi:hypothetical protein